MDASLAEKHNIKPLDLLSGTAVVGYNPDEMGIGPVFAVPELLKKLNLRWKYRFMGAQRLCCPGNILQRSIGIPDEKPNVNGGAISIGHPYGMSGARMIWVMH